MPRDYAAEHARSDELARDRGFDNARDQTAWVQDVRDQFDMDRSEMPFGQAIDIAQFEMSYDAGDMTRDELAEWWTENVGDIDYDDPDDPFWDFLDALSGEGAAT